MVGDWIAKRREEVYPQPELKEDTKEDTFELYELPQNAVASLYKKDGEESSKVNGYVLINPLTLTNSETK